ncbi:MAG: hypothetical protein ACLVJ6_16370, partial [Merdibacter sp.]
HAVNGDHGSVLTDSTGDVYLKLPILPVIGEADGRLVGVGRVSLPIAADIGLQFNGDIAQRSLSLTVVNHNIQVRLTGHSILVDISASDLILVAGAVALVDLNRVREDDDAGGAAISITAAGLP